MFSKINPYIWDGSASNVKSNIVSIEVDSCSKAASKRRRKKRNVEKQNREVNLEYHVELEIKEENNFQWFNGTVGEDTGKFMK